MKDEALKLALEVLQWSKPHKDAVITHGEAITAIEAALAQQADHSEQHLDMVKAQQEPWCMKMNGCETKCEDCPVEVAEPQPEERNFCPRCGKRTADLTVIHTCTPPQDNV